MEKNSLLEIIYIYVNKAIIKLISTSGKLKSYTYKGGQKYKFLSFKTAELTEQFMIPGNYC